MARFKLVGFSSPSSWTSLSSGISYLMEAEQFYHPETELADTADEEGRSSLPIHTHTWCPPPPPLIPSFRPLLAGAAVTWGSCLRAFAGAVPPPGKFFLQKPSWLVPSPHSSLCSEVTCSGWSFLGPPLKFPSPLLPSPLLCSTLFSLALIPLRSLLRNHSVTPHVRLIICDSC